MTHPLSTWSPEDDSMLRSEWAAGKSATEISRMLGNRSRNAVIGRAHRLGIASRAKPSAPKPEPKPKAAPKPKPEPKAKAEPKPKPYLVHETAEARDKRRAEMTKQGKGLLARLEALPVNDNAKPLMELGRYECRWPEGTPNRPSQQLCCGARVMLGEADAPLPYCAHHHAMAYRGKPKVSGVSRFHTRPGERRHVATVWDAGRAA